MSHINLTASQRRMLLASEPDRTREEGYGVELSTGADYATAKALKRRGFGSYTGPGGSLPGMYFSNAEGLGLRGELLGESASDEDDLDA